MKLSRLLHATEPFEIVTIVLLDGAKSTILFSGGSRDFRIGYRDYDVVLLQKEKDESYTILVRSMV